MNVMIDAKHKARQMPGAIAFVQSPVSLARSIPYSPLLKAMGAVAAPKCLLLRGQAHEAPAK